MENVTANVPLIDKRAKNHQGEIDIKGIGAHVHTTVNSKNILLPQTSLNELLLISHNGEAFLPQCAK